MKGIFVDSRFKDRLSLSSLKKLEVRDSWKTIPGNSWRTISLLNVNLNIISTVLAEKLREALPDLISSQETLYAQNRQIGENGRLISDVIDFTKTKRCNFLVTMDLEKAFDSIDHNLLIFSLKKYGFGQSFTQRLKFLLKDQESCVINDGKITKYFLFCRGARQGNQVKLFYLF